MFVGKYLGKQIFLFTLALVYFIVGSYRNKYCIKSIRCNKLYQSSVKLISDNSLTQEECRSLLIPADQDDIKDEYARSMLQALYFSPVSVPASVSKVPVITSFAQYRKSKTVDSTKAKVPLILIHGFDSSCMEFRRLAPLLAASYDVYVPDMVGWGFTEAENVLDFGPEAKLQHLKAFIEQVVLPSSPEKSKCVIVGASLGGGIAINLATQVCEEYVEKLVLLDPQAFIDGKGKSNLPDFFANLGIGVLKSRPLRSYANTVSYFNKSFASEQAYLIGRLHCLKSTWKKASVSFLKSGGFVISPNVPKVKVPTLVIWGKNDNIISVDNASRFQKEIKNVQVEIVDECGHVPHIEKSDQTSKLISSFLENM